MSMFGDGNWQKNELYDNIKMYFKDGGNAEDLFDVIRAAYEYDLVPSANLDLIQEIERLNKEVSMRVETYNSIQERIDRAVAILKGEE